MLSQVNETVVTKPEELLAIQQIEDQPKPPNNSSCHQDLNMPEKVPEDGHGEEQSLRFAKREKVTIQTLHILSRPTKFN